MKCPPFIVLMAICLASCAGPSSVLNSSSPDSSSLPEGAKYVYKLPKADNVQRLSPDRATSLRGPAMADLTAEMEKTDGNFVLSPASYLLSVSGLASVSRDFPLASFGLSDAMTDLKALLEAWNFEYRYMHDYGHTKDEKYCSFEAVVAHQSVGPTYRFDPAKRDALVQDYVTTLESSLADYHKDATSFFHDVLDFTIPVPDPQLIRDGVLTYGGFKVKDFVPGGLATSKNALFNSKVVSAHTFGSVYYPEYLSYYQGENYQVFRLPINYTSMVIVLPAVGTNINDISLHEAYSSFLQHGETAATVGYVPYFHNRTESQDITACIANKLKGKIRFYDALLPDTTFNDLLLDKVLQSNDFEFNEYGISGESITVVATVGASEPKEHEVVTLNVDRPFYAISEKDGFPLFINRVVSL